MVAQEVGIGLGISPRAAPSHRDAQWLFHGIRPGGLDWMQESWGDRGDGLCPAWSSGGDRLLNSS